MATELIGNRYRPLERHGVGGMAAVWRARDERTGEDVALKRIHPHLAADPTARARLEREAAALRLVDHPAIVRPREVIDDPEPALVMDFVEGRPLAARIADGPLPAEEAMAIAWTIADAVAVAHRQGIVHRDIKPANILVEDDGTLHLIDFGIASLGSAGSDGLTDARSMVGTLRYTAPERFAGQPASPRSDVWALGAVLYEMLTGRPAIAVDDPAAALAASRAGGPDVAGLPSGIRPVVTRAMDTDPAQRYPDAASFRDAVEAIQAPVDPEAATALVPLAAKQRGGLPPFSAGARRAAAVGMGLSIALLVLVASMTAPAPGGIGPAAAGVGGIPTASVPPSASTVPPTDGPAPGDHGKGHGNGKGKD